MRFSTVRMFRAAGVLLFAMGAEAQAQSMLTRHLPEGAISGQARFLNPLPAAQSLRIDIVLPLRDPAGLEKFLRDVYDPSNPNYRHFLSVPEFTAQYGPSQADYDAVVHFATSQGLTVYGDSHEGMDVPAEGVGGHN